MKQRVKERWKEIAAVLACLEWHPYLCVSLRSIVISFVVQHHKQANNNFVIQPLGAFNFNYLDQVYIIVPLDL